MSYPYDLSIGPDHYLYVCEYGNHRVQKFNLDGKSLGTWGSRAGGRDSSSIPMHWRSTAGAPYRSSIPTTIECSASGCELAGVIALGAGRSETSW